MQCITAHCAARCSTAIHMQETLVARSFGISVLDAVALRQLQETAYAVNMAWRPKLLALEMRLVTSANLLVI